MGMAWKRTCRTQRNQTAPPSLYGYINTPARGLMKKTHHHFTAIRILASSLAIMTALSLVPVHAGGPAASDLCSSPLPTELTFSGGGPNMSVYALHGRAGALRIMQFGGRGLTSDLHLLGYRVLPSDNVGEFELVTPGKTHVYAGPVHVFRHTRQQHVCRTGAIEVNATGSTTQQHNSYRLNVQIEGALRGRQARATVWIGSTHYTFTGTRTV